MSFPRTVSSSSLIALLLAVVGCTTVQTPSIERAIAAMPAKNLKSYQFDAEAPLIDRVAAAPDFVLKYLRDADNTDKYTAYLPSNVEKGQLDSYLSLLPESYQRTLEERLVAIYFISNWIGSGMADYVLDERKQLYAILVINPETMKHDLSEWITYRESTAFQLQGQGSGRLTVRIDCGIQYTGLMYLLLHETSHIMDYIHHYTPYVEDNLRALGLGTGDTDFTKGVWINYDTPVRQFDFASRHEISYYGLGHLLSSAQAPAVYGGLKTSPFASLYGSRNWAEDFAELCTWYHYTGKLKQPYRIVWSDGDGTENVLEPMKSELVQRRLKDLPVS